MHTTVANWLHVEEGKITALRVDFDARELAPWSSDLEEYPFRSTLDIRLHNNRFC